MSIPVKLLPGTFPSDCWPSPQEYNVAIFQLARAFVDTAFAGLVMSPTAPGANDRDKGWLHPNGHIYQWNTVYGDWMREYHEPPSSGHLIIWEDSLGDLDSYAGGSSGAVGPVSGPLWARATEYDGRVPIGVGTIPGTSPAVSITNVGDTQDSTGLVGERVHQLTVAELAKHNHAVSFPQAEGTDADPGANRFLYTPKANGGVGGGGSDVSTWPQVSIGPDAGSDTPHNNMMPFKGVYFARRTARVYVLAPY